MQNSHIQDKIIFFDGYCILCNRTVDFLIKHDRKKLLKFASLQSVLAANLLQSQNNAQGPDTVVFYDQGKFYYRSDAVLRTAAYLGFPYNMIKLGYLVPRPLRNRIYDYIARNRFRWFGQRNSCRMPDEKTKDRIISVTR